MDLETDEKVKDGSEVIGGRDARDKATLHLSLNVALRCLGLLQDLQIPQPKYYILYIQINYHIP